MDISAVFAADLDELNDALNEPGTDLHSLLQTLGADARIAITLFLGLTMTLVADGAPFSFTVLEPLASELDPKTSLLLPLTVASADVGPLVLYAAQGGAFVDMSADIAIALEVELSTLTLDEHLILPDVDVATDLSDRMVINQAIGVLLDRGRTPNGAHEELRRAAGHDGSFVVAAQQVVASTARVLR